VLVADASVLVVALADDGADRDTARTRLRGENLAAPELIALEMAAVLRRHTNKGLTNPEAHGLPDNSALQLFEQAPECRANTCEVERLVQRTPRRHQHAVRRFPSSPRQIRASVATLFAADSASSTSQRAWECGGGGDDHRWG
jgi:predicted nucleic acid-binding protein